MTLERAQDLRDSFNNGDFGEDIEPYFNDLITFFKFMKKYGLLGEIDLGQVSYRDWDDEIIEYLDDISKRYIYILRHLSCDKILFIYYIYFFIQKKIDLKIIE